MKRRDWILVYLPLPLLILLDWYSKSLALHYSNGLEGPFGPGNAFYMIYNHGAMLGLFSDLPQSLRIVSLSTFGAIIVGIYFLFQYLIPGTHLKLRFGLSVLVGGILGNVYDRIRYGAIIDFLRINLGSWNSPIFNPADAIQWVGYFIIAYFFIRESHTLWPEKNARKSFWVNAPFQRRFSLLLSAIVLIITGVFVVFCYTYVRVTLQELTLANQEIINRFVRPFVFLMIGLGFGSTILIYTLGKVFSHRIVGPVYAFERFLREVLKGNPAVLRLRKNDEFKYLEPFADEIKSRLEPIVPKSQLPSDVEGKIFSSDDPTDR